MVWTGNRLIACNKYPDLALTGCAILTCYGKAQRVRTAEWGRQRRCIEEIPFPYGQTGLLDQCVPASTKVSRIVVVTLQFQGVSDEIWTCSRAAHVQLFVSYHGFR